MSDFDTALAVMTNGGRLRMVISRCDGNGGRCPRVLNKFTVSFDGPLGVLAPVPGLVMALGDWPRCPRHGPRHIDVFAIVKAAANGRRSVADLHA